MNATSICVYDSFGRKIVERAKPASNLVTIDSVIVSGIYYVQVEFVNYLNETEKHIEKLIIN
jgi:hypothetical protein